MIKCIDISKPKEYGGYCPRCDTVWVSPGKCRCEKNNKNVEIKNVPVEISNDIWNAAIEAALYEIDDGELYCAVERLKK